MYHRQYHGLGEHLGLLYVAHFRHQLNGFSAAARKFVGCLQGRRLKKAVLFLIEFSK